MPRRLGDALKTCAISASLVLATLLAGCAPQVVSATPGAIIVAYPRSSSGLGEAMAIANKHCAEMNREAIPINDQPRDGLTNNLFVHCRPHR